MTLEELRKMQGTIEDLGDGAICFHSKNGNYIVANNKVIDIGKYDVNIKYHKDNNVELYDPNAEYEDEFEYEYMGHEAVVNIINGKIIETIGEIDKLKNYVVITNYKDDEYKDTKIYDNMLNHLATVSDRASIIDINISGNKLVVKLKDGSIRNFDRKNTDEPEAVKKFRYMYKDAIVKEIQYNIFVCESKNESIIVTGDKYMALNGFKFKRIIKGFAEFIKGREVILMSIRNGETIKTEINRYKSVEYPDEYGCGEVLVLVPVYKNNRVVCTQVALITSWGKFRAVDINYNMYIKGKVTESDLREVKFNAYCIDENFSKVAIIEYKYEDSLMGNKIVSEDIKEVKQLTEDDIRKIIGG